MSKDIAAQLTSLMKDHREGKLSLATYRELRAPLLDSLAQQPAGPAMDITGTPTQSRTNPRAPAGENAADVARLLAKKPAKRGSGSRSVVLGLITLMGVAAAAGAWWFRGSHKLGPTTGSAAVTEHANGAQNLIHEFLDRGDWGDERLQALRFTLGEVAPEEMIAARETPEFRRLRDEVRERLKEQQALAAAPLNPQESALAALAVKVGIDLESGSEVATRAPDKRVPEDAASRQQPVAQAAAAEPAQTSAPTSTCRAELIAANNGYCRDRLPANESGPRLVLVSAGTREVARVGTAAGEVAPRVTVRKAFAVSVQGVTQRLYRRFCETSLTPFPPQPRSGDDDPIVNVSWNEAREFLRWLSTSTGQRYRLPTEDEWEYAAQSAKDKFTAGNIREWVDASSDETAQGAESQSSSLGSRIKRIARGSLYGDGSGVLLSDRMVLDADARDALTGFRVLRELP